jgi:hypothetical protein
MALETHAALWGSWGYLRFLANKAIGIAGHAAGDLHVDTQRWIVWMQLRWKPGITHTGEWSTHGVSEAVIEECPDGRMRELTKWTG